MPTSHGFVPLYCPGLNRIKDSTKMNPGMDSGSHCREKPVGLLGFLEKAFFQVASDLAKMVVWRRFLDSLVLWSRKERR